MNLDELFKDLRADMLKPATEELVAYIINYEPYTLPTGETGYYVDVEIGSAHFVIALIVKHASWYQIYLSQFPVLNTFPTLKAALEWIVMVYNFDLKVEIEDDV